MKTLVVVISIFLANACLSAQSRTELEFASHVSKDRLQKTVRDLVRFGNRQGGTRSGDMSVAYILKKFKEIGLRTEVREDPPRLTFTNIDWKLKIIRPTGISDVFQNAWLAGFSPSVTKRRVRLVYISSADEIDRVRVESAAVLIPQHIEGQLYNRLASNGAACVLTWAKPNSKAYADCAQITSLGANDKNPLPVFNISQKSTKTLLGLLNGKEEVSLQFSTRTKIRNGKSRTVIATLPGRSSKYYLVCAHGDSDSGGPGADDNASGVTGVIEVARILTEMVHEKRIHAPDSTIAFIVWGSEYGSTEQYVKSHSGDLHNILAVLNFDEIGTGATRNCIYFEGNDRRINARLLKVFQKVGEDFVGRRYFWKEATTNPSQGGTDSYVFLPDYLGHLSVPVVEIPSITIYTAAWEEPKALFQPKEWRSKAWKGPADSVYIDYSMYYHSSLDVPAMTTDRKPLAMVWGVKAVGIALLRLDWH